jgi:two-component system response regulator
MRDEAVEVLLVEDDPNDIELTLRTLKKHNLANHVHVVRDGAEALEFLFPTQNDGEADGHVAPKVILLDLKLPKVDGIEVLRRIKDDPEARAMPVVVLTSSAEERDVVRSYQLGVNSYIIKPVEFEAFAQAIAQLGLYWLVLNKAYS